MKYFNSYRGIVVQNDDPEKMGRVKVFVPQVNMTLYDGWNNDRDTDKKFTIQSISKIISLMIAVREKGEQNVFDKMGYFGSCIFIRLGRLHTQIIKSAVNVRAILFVILLHCVQNNLGGLRRSGTIKIHQVWMVLKNRKL